MVQRDQAEEDSCFVMGRKEFSVFLTHLPHSFPLKTSTLSKAHFPNPEETAFLAAWCFWQGST